MLTCKDNHVHAPEYAHDPAHHDHSSDDLYEGSGDVQPKHTAHMSVLEIRPGTEQNCKG